MSKSKTFIDLVRDYFPDATDEECDYILWEKTSFPMAGLETINEQLRFFRDENSEIEINKIQIIGIKEEY